VNVYCDANGGSSPVTRRSTSGVFVCVSGAPAIFRSKKHATVALPSAKTEYMALAVAMQEALWVWHLLEDMRLQLKAAILVCIDNKSVISMATSSGYTSRAKHIDLRYHFVCGHVT
jgi:hypothetical protein